MLHLLLLNMILTLVSTDFFISVGLGLGGTDAPQVRSRKSMSNERTFSATKDEAFFHQKLGDMNLLLCMMHILLGYRLY